MQSITKYTIPIDKSSFTLSIPQYSHCLELQIDFAEDNEYKPIFSIAILSDNQWPLIDRQFYLFKEKEEFNLYSGLPNDYYLPITYIGSLTTGNSDYYLFVRDEK